MQQSRGKERDGKRNASRNRKVSRRRKIKNTEAVKDVVLEKDRKELEFSWKG